MNRQSVKFFPSLVVALALPDEAKKEKATAKTHLIKPSQLPLYEEPQDIYSYEYFGKEKSKFEDGVSVARKELQSAFETTSDMRESVKTIYETGKAHSLATTDYVLDDANVPAKIGAITVGGLLGLLIGGRRKGVFKKLFYTSLGATGAAALVYPKEASQIGREVYDNAGDYSVIAYNFIAGVKPQNGQQTTSPPQGPPKPKTPPANNAPSEVSTPPQQDHHRSFRSLLHQSSDMMLWGFRLFDRSDKTQSITSSNNESKKDVVVNVPKTPSSNPPQTIQGDIGQSNPEDKDMYTTRS